MTSIRRRLLPLAAAGAIALTAVHAQASGLQTLYSFTGGADGATPYKGPTLDAAGTLYGTAFAGANACPDSYGFAGVGCGTVWKLSGGTLTPVLTFLGASNGASPFGNVIVPGKTIYGTTYAGGALNQGTVFQVSTSGTGYKRIHSFTGSDGEHPDSTIRTDSAGNGYSVAPLGGPGYTGTDDTGSGVLFEISHTGTYIPLHFFSAGLDGAGPGRIFLDANGNIFGAAGAGGSCTGTGVPSNGCGVVYEYTIVSGQFQVIYTFTGGSDGFGPTLAGIDPSGNLVGYTETSGAHGFGSLFRINNNGGGSYSYSKLWDFTGGADGAYPNSPPTLLPGAGDKMVGTTLDGPVSGTSNGFGTLWQYAGGKVTNLYTFTGGADGGFPQGTPVLDKANNIYGTTAYGGIAPCNTSGGTLISSLGCGTVFKYVP